MSREARLQFIDEQIKYKKYVTVKEVSSHYEVSEKTIHRDIEYLRDSCNAPILFDRKVGGYIYEYDFKLYTNEKEKRILFYSLIRNLSKNLNYIPVACDDFLRQLEASMDSDILAIADRIHYEVSDAEPVELEVFSHILSSMRHKLLLQIRYTSRDGKSSKREIEVFRIINYSGKWYILSYCHLSGAVRNFMVTRIDKSELTSTPWSYFVESNLDLNFKESSFGIFKEQSVDFATLAFSKEIYHIVKNQIWHPLQKKELRNEKLYLTFPIGSQYEELIGRILKFGAEVEVVAPTRLRVDWLEQIKRMYNKFLSLC